MPSCSIKQCSARRSKNKQELTVHRFPKSGVLRQRWLEVIGTKNLNTHHKELYICSLHFEESQFNRTLDVIRLRHNAVPTFITFPDNNHEQPDCEMETTTRTHFLVISADDSNPKGPRIKISPSIPNEQEDTKIENVKIENDADGPMNSRNSETEQVDADKSCVLQACRVCLAVDCKMFQLKKRKLRQAYTKVTGIAVSPSDGHPQLLCWECAARVHAAAQLRHRAVTAHGVLDALLRLNGAITMGDIRSIDRQRAKLTSQLSCENFEYNECGGHFEGNLPEVTKTEIVDDVAEYNASDIYENEEYIDEEFETYTHYEDIYDSSDRKDEIDDQQEDDKNMKEVYVTNDVEAVYDDKRDDDDYVVDDDDDEDDESASEDTEQTTSNTNKLQKQIKAVTYKKQKDNASRDEFLSQFFTITAVSVADAIAAVRDRKHSKTYKSAAFKCNICYRGYPTMRRYEDHALKHTEKFGSIECLVCKLKYKTRLSLIRHQTSHRRKYACKQCGVVTSTSTAALYHRASHEGAKFQCPHCPRVFNTKTAYYGHVRIKHVCEFVCELCGHTFLSKFGVDIHKNRRHVLDKATPLTGPHCAACDVTFASHAAHDTHLTMSSKHNQDKDGNIVNTYEANAPKPRQRRERERTGRPRGIPTVHTPVTCELCGAHLLSVMSYVSHFRRTHPGATRVQHLPRSKSVVCDQCGRKFHCMSLLRDHMAAHRGERVSCDECGKRFFSKVRLGVHMKVHQPIRPTYPCKICDKEFTNSGNMKRHLLKHMIPLPYKCEACGKCLTTPTGLKSHVDHVHNGVPWPKRMRNRSKESRLDNIDNK